MQLLAVFASALKFLHPAIITLFALKVNFPATVGVADTDLVVRKYKFPTASETDEELEAADIAAVAEDVSVVEPTIFVAVTATFRNCPTSAATSEYELFVAPAIAV